MVRDTRGAVRRPSGFIVSLERKKLAVAVATALAMPAIGLQSAHAQQQTPQAQQQPEEITVTGSRIVRRDYDANSPIQTIDKSAFEQQNSIALETALNELPQFVPAAQGLTQLQDQSQMTDNFTTLTAGASTISLRGLGANRNLVLLDGYRAVPVNATMAVDVNSIPAAAIERVEVITGGASSVYGADAVAGVVNFILKKNFEGLDLDIQSGSMQNGNGRGDACVSVVRRLERRQQRQHHGRPRAGQARRDTRGRHRLLAQRSARRDHLSDAADLHGPVFHDRREQRAESGRRRCDLQPARCGRCRGREPTGANAGRIGSTNIYWNEDGTLYTGGASFSNGTTPAGAGSTAGAYRYNGPTYTSRTNANNAGDYPFRYVNNEGQIVQHILPFEANIPLDRSSVFGRATYDISDNVSAYAQFLNVSSKTRRYLHGLSGGRRLGQHRAARQRRLRAVVGR